MTRLASLLVLFVGTLALSSSALSANQLEREEPINLHLRDADLVEVLGVFATIQDLTLDVPSNVTGKVTVHLNAVPWQQALDEICRINDLQCHVVPPHLLVRSGREAPSPDGQPITLDLLQADLHETLRTFGAITDTQVTIDPALTPRGITVSLAGVPWPLALEEVCRLGGCLTAGTAEGIRITALPAAAVRARRIDLALDNTPLRAIVDHFSGLPMWGGTMQLEVEPTLAERPVTIDVRDANWSDLLDALCNEAACNWKLIYDQSSVRTLRITSSDSLLTQEHDLAAFEGLLGEAVSQLRETLKTAVQRIGGLSAERPVGWSSGRRTGSAMLDELCAQADCTWHLRGRGVVLAPRRVAFAQAPAKGAQGPTFLARIKTPKREPADATVRFSWAHPVARLGDDDGQAIYVWLPFGDGRQTLLPIVTKPTAQAKGGHQVAMLEPILLPQESPWTSRALGIELSLTPQTGEAPDSAPLASMVSARHQCDPAQPVVTVRAPDLPWQQLELASHPGHFLLLTPPTSPDTKAGFTARPAAALVTLGLDAHGTATVAVVQPRPDGSFAVERIRVDARGNHAQIGDTALTLQLTPRAEQ